MSENKCKACENSGLPIVFLFHGAVAEDAELAPHNANALATDQASVQRAKLPKLSHARYVLRSLRPGAYLHVYHETPSDALKQKAKVQNEALKKAGRPIDPSAAHWEVFRVLPGGALVPQEHPHFAQAKPFACQREGGSHIHTVMTYRLADAHLATTIKVAVSANLWDKTTRDRNQSDPDAMTAISISMALAGGKWPTLMRPTAEWIEKHIADFALDNIDHAYLGSSMPLAKVKGQAENLLQRMSTLSRGHDKTLDKGFFFALPDPAGTAIALAEISLARHKQGLDYVQANSHGFAAASRIQMLKESISQAELNAAQELQGKNPLTESDLKDPMGRPAFSELDQAQLRKLAQSKGWIKVGEMRHQGFIDDTEVRGRLPRSAKFFQYNDIARGGLVVAPLTDLAQINAKQAGTKIERLHKRKELEAFLKNYEARLKRFEAQVHQHDDDRSLVLARSELAQVMRTHYNAAAAYDRRATHNPGETYMAECQRMLAGAGQCSPKLLEHMRKLLQAKANDDLGWALRAMVGNQQSLFAPMDTWLEHSVNWLTSPDAKLDKAYDTYKTLITDDWTGGYLKAKLGWLTPSGIALSFGLQGFLAGAATQILAQSLEKPLSTAKTAAANSASKIGSAASKATQSKAEAALAKLDSAEGQLAARIHSWCHHQSLVLRALLDKQPPPRPMLVRAEVSLRMLQTMTTRLAAEGKPVNRSTRAAVKAAGNLPDAMLDQKLHVDLLVTDADLRNVPALKDLAAQASHVRLQVLSDVSGKLPILALDEAGLQALYQKAHRYDPLKKALTDALGQGLPASLAYATTLAATPLRAAAQGVKAATMPGGLVSKAAKGASAVGAVAGESGLSFFGALLQWRLYEANEERRTKLGDRLLQTPGLSQDQRDAIQEQIELTKLGSWDNIAGMTGGVFEIAAIALTKVMNTTPSATVQARATLGAAGFAAFAAFAGAAGSFLNAQQNYLKAARKRSDGDLDRAEQYMLVSRLYFSAGLALGAAGIEVTYTWVTTRKLVEMSLRGAAGRAATAAAGRTATTVAARAFLGLSLTGWGLVFTVLAVGYEAVVAYNDRTALEEWVECSYWGVKPQWRDKHGSKANGAEQESKAFDTAAKKAIAEAAAYETLEPTSVNRKVVTG